MEEKKSKIQRTTQSSSTTSSDDNDTSQSDYIPLELTLEILSRLPAKSVGRCRCVSKLWSTITTTQDFLESFATRSSRPSFLITIERGDILLLFSPDPLRKNSFDGPLSCLGSYQFTSLDYGLQERFDYVRGLFLLQGYNQLVLWNPTLKRFFTLPEPKGTKGNNNRSSYSNSIGAVLGHDRINGKYIVLRVLRNSKICILTLGAQGKKSRRIITNGFPEHRAILRCGTCINGVMYYQANVSVGVGFKDRILMSFDVRSEKFNRIRYPKGYCYWRSWYYTYMVSYEGRLAIVEIRKFPCIYLWILANGDRHEWTRKRYVLPISETHPIRDQEKELYGVSDAGELVFAQRSLSQSFNILYFDPSRNSIREVSFDVGDEFRRRYGLIGKKSMYTMKVYPNHIESLVPL